MGRWCLGTLVVAALLGGCSSTRLSGKAPVEERSVGQRTTTTEAVATPAPATAAPVVNENANKPGYYTVKPGDSVIRIALESGQNWRDIVRWNSIENPNRIEVGQVLRVAPPTEDATAGVVVRPLGAGGAPVAAASSRPNLNTVTNVVTPTVPAPATSAAVPAASPTPPAAAASAALPPVSAGEDDVAWIWPASGAVVGAFEDPRNKGLDIGGKAGDPVVAAGDGTVVYAGSGLRGYGNLIILKHNNTFLTAYAHNQTLLVKENQSVRKGQRIAEMGSSDSERVKLHFEIRRQGKPVDPAKYLPAR